MKNSLLLFLLSMAVGVNAQQKLRDYKNKDLGFGISYPIDWSSNYRNSEKHNAFTAMKSKRGRNAASLWVHVSDCKKHESLDSLTFAYMKILRADGNLIHGGSETSIGGTKFYTFYTSVEADERSKRCDFYLAKTDTKFYIVSLTFYRSVEYETYKADFRQIIDTFRIY